MLAATRALLIVVVSGCMLLPGAGARADGRVPAAAGADPDDIVRLMSTTAQTVGRLAEGLDEAREQRVSTSSAPPWTWPLPGPQVPLRSFDGPIKRWLPGHRGVDLAGWRGAAVRSVADGVVSYSGEINDVGIVSVLHPDGILSTYQPVVDSLPQGSSVRSGQRVGAVGDQGSHCWPISCLHLGARIGRDYIDPMLLLRPWEVSLLPGG